MEEEFTTELGNTSSLIRVEVASCEKYKKPKGLPYEYKKYEARATAVVDKSLYDTEEEKAGITPELKRAALLLKSVSIIDRLQTAWRQETKVEAGFIGTNCEQIPKWSLPD